MEWKNRLTLSLYVTLIKIGLVELFFLLNFSMFSYSNLEFNTILTYLTFGAIYFLLYYGSTYLNRWAKEFKYKRVSFLIIATSIFFIKMLIFELLGFISVNVDLSTIGSLLFVEVISEFTFIYSIIQPKLI